MKMIITPKDVPDLIGKFVIQLDEAQPNNKITHDNWNFIHEKRLSLITYNKNGKLCMQGFFYSGREFDSPEQFVEFFNTYGDNTRFHRLLTSRELDFVCNKFKTENY